MLNKNNERELAYLVKIDDVQKHPNADKLDLVTVGGWTCITGIGEFNKGDIGIFFEIDSKLPEKEPWTEMEFLVSKHFKIRTQKIRGIVSQGLVVHPSILGWAVSHVVDNDVQIVVDDKGNEHYVDDESRFLTKQLEVTYAAAEDNARKAPTVDKYKKMAQKHPKAARTWIWRTLWKSKLGKDILFFFFGKNIRKDGWPNWVVKTDEERIENMPWIFTERDENGEKYWWIPTEKTDGSSSTFTMKKSKAPFRKDEFLVCSRNVVFDKPDKKCFYDSNIYIEMADKYDVEKVLATFISEHPACEWVTIQGETFGAKVQNRDYSMKDRDLLCFNLIDSVNGRWNSNEAAKWVENHGMKWVPIFEKMQLPDTLEELRAYVHSTPSKIDGGMREGIVFRSLDGKRSFKCVDPEYLIKYHQ